MDIYIRMKKKITVTEPKKVTINDIAFLQVDEKIKQMISKVPILHIMNEDNGYIVIDAFTLTVLIKKVLPNANIQLVGPNETIIHTMIKKNKRSFLMLLFVWIILFVGTAMTMINFHFDVSMHEVHQKLHFILTGNEVEQPLWIQIPYSFGLGLGMILFLNHWFKKRIHEEPSPLELELFNYQKNIDDYIKHYENDLNDEKRFF